MPATLVDKPIRWLREFLVGPANLTHRAATMKITSRKPSLRTSRRSVPLWEAITPVTSGSIDDVQAYCGRLK